MVKVYHLANMNYALELLSKTVHKLFTGNCCRSTSVGDIFKLEDGKKFLVSNFSFAEIKE